eukprot:4891119-Pyramimonas_sp.AAC.1
MANAAGTEKGMMGLKAIITHPTPYIEHKQGKGLTLGSFDLPLLSRDTPVRPLLRDSFTVPGLALEGPAKPSTPENGLPIHIKLT